MNKDLEYILCAAIHLDDGKQYDDSPRNINSGFVVCGYRHHNCINILYQLNKFGEETQGFLTSYNRFLNREETKELALKNKQIDKTISNTLTSEDFY